MNAISSPSPTTILGRINTKFDWEAIFNSTKEKGFETVEDVWPEDIESMRAYMEANRCKSRTRYNFSEKRLSLSFPSLPHERAIAYIIEVVHTFNYGLTGKMDHPVRNMGSSFVRHGEQSYSEPDCSFRTTPRKSNNVVFEVAVAEPMRSLVNILHDYIRLSDDIMIAMGCKVWEYPENGNAAMLIVMYVRQIGTNNPILFEHTLKSFGSRTLSPEQIADVYECIGGVEPQGVGFGHADCDNEDDPFYHIEIPRNLLICLDNYGEVLPAGIVFQQNNHCVFNLFRMQQNILEFMFE